MVENGTWKCLCTEVVWVSVSYDNKDDEMVLFIECLLSGKQYILHSRKTFHITPPNKLTLNVQMGKLGLEIMLKN